MLRRIVIALSLIASLMTAIPASADSNLTVGVAYDIGGRGDRAFNDAAAAGLQKAQKDSILKLSRLSPMEQVLIAKRESAPY